MSKIVKWLLNLFQAFQSAHLLFTLTSQTRSLLCSCKQEMAYSETEELVDKPPPMEALEKGPDPTDSTTKNQNRSNLLNLISEPIQWLQMLCKELNASFVFGVVLVYGFSQGFLGSFFRVVSDYYWKDVQEVQPSAVQLYIGLYYIPWVMKPVWGLLTDVFPVHGYRRRPYFILAGEYDC